MGNTSIKKQDGKSLLNNYHKKEASLSESLQCCMADNEDGVSVVWKNLSVTACIKEPHIFHPSKKTYKRIIHNVNGAVQPGNLVAILGSSGSGKTTLMSVLANRKPGDLITSGDIRINGRPIGKFMREISGYVFQEDLFIPTLTVMEHLNFTAQLKLDHKICGEIRRKLIVSILKELGLLNCIHRRIGTDSSESGKGQLSGGEKKRLSVATELLTDPQLLFCDEPTTGLDSYSALNLVTMLKNMAVNEHRTIICSIHQPSEKMFHLFHQIILLYCGQIAYIGTPDNAVLYFKSLGYEYNENQNPADYIVKSMAIIPGYEEERKEKVTEICKTFQQSKYASEINSYIEDEIQKYNYTKSCYFERQIPTIPWIFKLYIVTHRKFKEILRDPSIQIIKVIQKIVLAILIGLCMQGSVKKTQPGIQALQGVVFSTIAENFFPPLYAMLDHLPSQMPIFYREYANNTTTTLLFLISNILSLIPGYIIDPLLYSLIIYWFTDLEWTLSAILLTSLISILVANTSVAFGMCLSSAFNSQPLASIVTIPVDVTFMVLSGIYINLRTVPWIFQWVRHISWFTYGCEALFIIQMRAVDNIECLPDLNLPCLKTGAEVLDHYDYKDHLWLNISSMFLSFVILNMISYVFLAIRIRTRSR